MKKYNITTVKSYEKNGEQKKFYPNVGTLTKFDATNDKPEGFILELNMFPDTKFFVFEEKPKEETKTLSAELKKDIPF